MTETTREDRLRELESLLAELSTHPDRDHDATFARIAVLRETLGFAPRRAAEG